MSRRTPDPAAAACAVAPDRTGRPRPLGTSRNRPGCGAAGPRAASPPRAPPRPAGRRPAPLAADVLDPAVELEQVPADPHVDLGPPRALPHQELRLRPPDAELDHDQPHQGLADRLGAAVGDRHGRPRLGHLRPERHPGQRLAQVGAGAAEPECGVRGDHSIDVPVLPADVDGRARQPGDAQPTHHREVWRGVAGQVVLHAVLGAGARDARPGDVHELAPARADRHAKKDRRRAGREHRRRDLRQRGGAPAELEAAVLREPFPDVSFGVAAAPQRWRFLARRTTSWLGSLCQRRGRSRAAHRT